MSSPVETLPESPSPTTLAAAWVDFVGHEEALPLDRQWATSPYVQASIDIAKLCTATCTDPSFDPSSSRLWAGIEAMSATIPETEKFDDRIMHFSLVSAVALIEGRASKMTTEHVRRLTHKRSVHIATQVNAQIKATEGEVSPDLLRTRADMTLLGLATFYPALHRTFISALPHQKYGAAPFKHYNATMLEAIPDQPVVGRNLRFSCRDQQETQALQGLTKTDELGVTVISACCELERSTDTCEENIASLASRLARTRHHRANTEDMAILGNAYDFLTEAATA